MFPTVTQDCVILQVVGGAEAYTAACRACYHSLTVMKGQAAPLTDHNRKPHTHRQASAYAVQALACMLL